MSLLLSSKSLKILAVLGTLATCSAFLEGRFFGTQKTVNVDKKLESERKNVVTDWYDFGPSEEPFGTWF